MTVFIMRRCFDPPRRKGSLTANSLEQNKTRSKLNHTLQRWEFPLYVRDDQAMKKPFIAVLNLNRMAVSILMRYANEHTVLGFDFSQKRVQQLLLKKEQLQTDTSRDRKNRHRIVLSHTREELRHCKMYWIVVPQKELLPGSRQLKVVKRYTALVGSMLKAGDWVFFVSSPNNQFVIDTCMPLLEQVSGLKERNDFRVVFTGIHDDEKF